MALILRRPLRKQRASKDAPEGVRNAARATWILLRGPFGAPQDEGGETLRVCRNSRRGLRDMLAWREGRASWPEIRAKRSLCGHPRGRSRPRHVGLFLRRRDGRRAALSVNENLDSLRVVMDDKIEADENARQDVSQGTREASTDDFVQRQAGAVVQISLLAQRLKHIGDGVVIDAHLHLVAIAVHDHLGARVGRGKGR
jgi:hypothetical protein